MIHMLQPALTEDEFIKLGCALILDCFVHDIPVPPEDLLIAAQFQLSPKELHDLIGKVKPGMQAILERRAREAAA